MPLDADTILENAAEPQSASVDGRAAAQVPIPDQIAAVKFQAQQDALDGTNVNGGRRSAWVGRFAKAVPPGGS